MRPPAHMTSVDESQAHRPLLYTLLGLISALSALDALLDEGAPDGSPSRDADAPERPASGGVLAAILGVVALRRACGRHLIRIASRGETNAGTHEVTLEGTRPTDGSLLR